MSREKPYISKPPEGFFDLVQSALQCTFFLVHESGPTSFLLKDESQKPIKVSLGSHHTCSCGGGREHCLHTLYVLLKIFRILPDNPILWQLSYIDSEINWLIKNRHNPMLEKKEVKKGKKQNSSTQRISLSEEVGCPICQEDMKELTELVYCKVGCGHNFHIKCMKIWAEHKVSQRDNITCPLCRTDWGNNVLAELNRLLTKSKKPKKQHKSAACVGCGQHPIRGDRFHCLICPRCDLCKKCADNHGDHPFIKKKSEPEKWEPVIRLNEFRNLENRELGSEDYERLLELDRSPPLFEYLLNIIPTGQASICVICSISQPCNRWKLLDCGHSVHDVCLLSNLQEENYMCPADHYPILKGLEIECLNLTMPARTQSLNQELTVNGQQIAAKNEARVRIRKRPNPPSAHVRREELYLGPPPRGRFNETRDSWKRRQVQMNYQAPSRQDFELPGLVITKLAGPASRKVALISSAHSVLNQ